jgi:YbgC/YbaW family acyl-CoA thioester hydrolase
MSALHEHVTSRRVEFADTDMAGIMHFARFFVFMETAEHELLHRIGGDVGLPSHEGGRLGWPRVQVSCEYLAPARFGDEIEIRVRVLRKGSSSLTYGIDLRRGDTLLARGRVTTVCCLIQDGGMRSIRIPRELADRLEEAPPEPTDASGAPA